MCPPVLAIAGFAVSAASTVMGFAAQQQQADAQSAAWRQNYTNALAAARDSQNQLTQRQEQEADAAGQKEHMNAIEVAQKSASVAASAATGGVSGVSVDALVTEVQRQGDLNQVAIQRNFQNTVQQLQAQKDATNDQAQSRINSMQQGSEPNPLSAGLNIVGEGLDSYNKFQKATNGS